MPGRSPHPFFYALLYAPFGVVSGFNTVALVNYGTRHGLSEMEAASLIAVGMGPHTIKWLFAPVVDTSLTRKRWYQISGVLCAIGIFLMAAVPTNAENLGTLEGVILVTNVACALLGMAVEGMMAHLTRPEDRGSVSGWFQAGNLGGGGMGGGAGLYLIDHLPAPWMSGAILGVFFLACIAVLGLFPDVPADARDKPLPQVVTGLLKDLLETVSTRGGLLCAILCFLPINTGAATGVLAQDSVASQWFATSEDASNAVAWVNGNLSGLISAIGCLAGGWLCVRLAPRTAYGFIGVLMAATTATMATVPFTGAAFIGFGLLYAFVTGLSYAAFTAFVLDAIGSKGAATKYNIFAALSNIPITYMGLVLANAVKTGGAKSMLYTESSWGLAGIGALIITSYLLRGFRGIRWPWMTEASSL